MLRIVVSEKGQPELPAIDVDAARIVIGSAPDANVRLPSSAARNEHVIIEKGKWLAVADVIVDDEPRRSNDVGDIPAREMDARTDTHAGVTRAGGGPSGDMDGRDMAGRDARAGAGGVVFDIGGFRVRVMRAPINTSPSPPQRTESLARELMRSLLGNGAAPTLTIKRGLNAGAKRALQPPESKLVIGRGDDADWVIVDEDLSRTHAEVRRSWDGTMLRDLESQNGTIVDGKRIVNQTEVMLRDGMSIELGNLVLAFDDPAERHLRSSNKKPAVRDDEKPPKPALVAKPSALPFVIAAVIAGLALVALVYVLAS